MCTRTQPSFGTDAIGFSPGRGVCWLTYAFQMDGQEISVSASGELVDGEGGILAITGGSRNAIGAYGEIELSPVNLLPDGTLQDMTEGNIFADPLFYEANIAIRIPCSEE